MLELEKQIDSETWEVHAFVMDLDGGYTIPPGVYRGVGGNPVFCIGPIRGSQGFSGGTAAPAKDPKPKKKQKQPQPFWAKRW